MAATADKGGSWHERGAGVCRVPFRSPRTRMDML